jgi:hypothetical protein
MRITPFVAVSLLLSGSIAQAASRAVLIPVVVGSGSEPPPELMAALSKGLQDNPGWLVVDGAGLKGLMAPPAGLKSEDRTRLTAKLVEASAKIKSAPKDAVAELETARTELLTAAKDLPLVDADHELTYRASGLLVAALVASGDTDRAKAVAIETVAQFPGHKPGASDGLPDPAVELLTASALTTGTKLTFKTRPEGCEVFVNGTGLGKAPVEILASATATYQAHAVCPTATVGATALKSFPKRVFVGDKESTRVELLDADFERAFEADGGQRLRFSSSADRRTLEDAFARRVAERYSADAVILASVGELSGADWLNGRLYLSSGYLNRQALVRLEPGRAMALGRYLATGKDSPGVLKPEEAGALVASSQASAVQAQQTNPWYTDIVGWSFTGVGAVGITLGLLSNAAGRRTTAEADAVRGDSERQGALYRDAERSKFYGGIGLVGGGLMAITGIVLLAIPEYTSNQSELFVFSPAKGGGTLSMSGRF